MRKGTEKDTAPAVGNKEDKKKICPCVWHKDEIREMGHCHCMLFMR